MTPFEFIKDNPNDWKFIAKLIEIYARDQHPSLRDIATEMGITHMGVKKRIVNIADKIEFTLGFTPRFTVDNIEFICKSILCGFNSNSKVYTQVYTQVYNETKETKKDKDKEDGLLSHTLLSIEEIEKKEIKKDKVYEKKHNKEHARNDVIEFNDSILSNIDRTKESYTPYETYLLWISDECPDLLKIMKLPREDNYLKMLGYFGFDIIKETIRDMNNNLDYLIKKKYKEIGQTSYNWAKRNHPFGKPMIPKNSQDVNEVKFCAWANKNYPALNALPIPFGYEEYCYLISIFDQKDVVMKISYLSGTGFKNVVNLKDTIEYMLNKNQNEKN